MKREAENEIDQNRGAANATAQSQVSDGQKGNWQDVNRGRRPRKVKYGKNTADLNMEGAEAATFKIFIGNTHPKSNRSNCG